jgi:hypothetical protein
MGSLDKRIEDLERLIKPPQDEGAGLRRAVMRGILDELSSLTSCRSTNSYRGGKPPTPIQPTDPTGDAYGYPYTRGQLLEYAIRRALGRGLEPHEVTEGLIASWSEALRENTAFGEGWDEIEAEEPPGRTQPWRGGS